MSAPEDRDFDFDDLNPSEDFSGKLEPPAEAPPEGPLPGEPAETEAETAAAEAQPEAAHAQEVQEPEQTGAEAGKRAAVPLSEKLKAWWEELKTADPFNVMLALTVAALFIAILCCLIELGRYHFNVSAKKAVGQVSITAPADIDQRFC